MRAWRRPLLISLGPLTGCRRILEPARQYLDGLDQGTCLAFQPAHTLFQA